MKKIFDIQGKPYKTNKKGQIGDIMTVLIVITSIVLTLMLGRFVYVKIDEGLKDSGLSTVESEKAMVDMGEMFSIFDNAMIFIMIGLTIGLLVSSFLLPTHPIFLPLNIVGLIVLVFMAGIMTNLYSDIVEDPEINAVLTDTGSVGYTDFSKSGFIMTKLPWLCAFIVFISTIVLYSKGKQEQFNF